MRIYLDQNSPVPLYAQILAELRNAIAIGEVSPGEQLPTVRQLAVDLRINPNTVARAYSELERAGLISTQQGRGTFVLERRRPGQCEDRADKLDEIVRRALGEAAEIGCGPDEVLRVLRARLDGWKGR